MQCPIAYRQKALSGMALAGAILVWCMALFFTLPATAAEFSISPVSLQFAPGTRSAVVSISNADTRPLRFQLSLVEWTQDANGADVYTPSDDLVFFPRQLTVRPGDKAVARVGPKHGVTGIEKTYRLRVEELPELLPETQGATLDFTITFAIPVFLGPQEAKSTALIAPMQLQDGKLLATVQNTGQSHFRIEFLEVKGADGYSQKLGGWYLLVGSSRQHTLNIPPEICRTQRQLKLSVKVGEQMFSSDLDIEPSMCGT